MLLLEDLKYTPLKINQKMFVVQNIYSRRTLNQFRSNVVFLNQSGPSRHAAKSRITK